MRALGITMAGVGLGLAAGVSLAGACGGCDGAEAAAPSAGADTVAAGSAGERAAGGPALGLGELTTAVLGALHPDGTSDAAQLQSLLTSINRQVAAHLVLDRAASCDSASAASEPPLGGAGWRLWVFWAVDVPECDGLASALVQLRASGLAAVRPVHLCGLHHWEAWMADMNAQREALVAAAQAQDAGRCARLSQQWRDQVREFVAEITAFYHGSVPVMGSGRIAQALQVDHVPCFRLISPSRRVHALDGFHAGFPLVAWVAACQAWEAQADQHAVPTTPPVAGTP